MARYAKHVYTYPRRPLKPQTVSNVQMCVHKHVCRASEPRLEGLFGQEKTDLEYRHNIDRKWLFEEKPGQATVHPTAP